MKLRTWLAGAACAASSLLAPPSAHAQQKFALQLFHFNVQYVCGGTIGLTPQPNPALDLDNDAVEDAIIAESFAPIVELFERHPSWGVDLEMQGYMLDVMAARHPETLAKMRVMAQNGQVDVVSFHYSDQLFIGYPETDWQRSQQLTRDTFAKHDVPLSTTVFCQEGQAAPAMAAAMETTGYRTMVWPKNLWSYQHGDNTAEPLYRFGNLLMIQGGRSTQSDAGGGIEMSWTFLDDGELLATNDNNPYFPELFVETPEAVTAYEMKLEALEQQGVRIATVRQYIEAVEPLLTPAEPPPLLDGTWQPNSTGGVARWLGGSGLWKTQERDNQVHTLGAVAHRELVAAETMAAEAGIDAAAELQAAWRLLFLGQVTDASGINPFGGEIRYGIAHLAEATRIARDVIRRGKATMGKATVIIDPAASTVTDGGETAFRGDASEAAVALQIEGADRGVTERWERIADGHHRLQIDFGAGDLNDISVRFEGTLENQLLVGLALDDDQPTLIDRSAFSFEEFHFALPTGLIGLGAGRYIIKDMAQVHLAATIRREDGNVVFHDGTAPTGEAQRWVFHLVEGSIEEATALALALNVQRRLKR
jgi:hypothetical protein